MAAMRELSRSISKLRPFPSIIPALFISYRGMASKLFLGGLSCYTTEQGLSEAFSRYGEVTEVSVVMDRVSDRSKGFGFLSYATEEEAEKAIAEMNGKQLNGRTIFVDYAKPRSRRGAAQQQ
ncbi:small RNA-binding protein 11, chloroplastic-like [Andrographis paniculata]|uniref:small RNA-binding protein 11, chloroplastic-like n=1 Tax=Andrographis paniculata TaxID=175694 RepID=UPI0021E7D883|nr:small RNA-binding protein 11, chloroplastic-like [Andrographis paniculata]XP_051132068.1 small RNA-binding protein 11, chloroplastic-like [Andrographis paniculata]